MTSENFNLKQLEEFINRWIHKIIPQEVTEEEYQPVIQKKKNYFLIFLKILPWVSLFVFLLTIIYDPLEKFSIFLPWRDDILSLKGILRMLAVTGLVGYGTNYIAIKMLFHPRKKRPILGQGLIPASKIKIAYRLGEAISKEIINPQLIVKQIKDSAIVEKYLEKFNKSLQELVKLEEFQKDLMTLIEFYINSILKSEPFRQNIKQFIKGIDFENLSGLESSIIKFYRFIGGDQNIANKLEEILLSMEFKIDSHEYIIKEYLHYLPDLIYNNKENLEKILLSVVIFLIERIQIKKIIINNLLEFDELRLERLLLHSTSDQLEYIQYLGCLLGILGGLFIWIPYESFILFLIMGTFIVILDILLYRNKKK